MAGRPDLARVPSRFAGGSADFVMLSAGSVSTGTPARPAYGRTVSMQRTAGELITRARGAKVASSAASAAAAAAPPSSSGRSASLTVPFGTAWACLTMISGTVGTGARPATRSRSWG